MLISSLRKAQWQTEILDFARKHNGIWENWFSMLAAPFTAVTPCVVYCCAYYTLPTLAAPRGEQTRHVYLGHMKGATWCDFKGVSSFSAILEKYHKKDSWRKSHVCSISRWCWKWHCCSNHSFHTKCSLSLCTSSCRRSCTSMQYPPLA